MAEWLLSVYAQHEAGDKGAAKGGQDLVERSGPRYPDCDLMLDLGSTFDRRLAFYLQHEVGIGIYYVYYYPASGGVDTHLVYPDEEKFARLIRTLHAKSGFVKPEPRVVARDVLAFLRRPAPARS